MPPSWLHWVTTYKDVLAPLIASLGITFLLFQITQAARHERARLLRRRRAATAALPLTLSTLSQYASDMIRALAPIQRWLASGKQKAEPEYEKRDIPYEAITAIERMIEVAPNDKIGRSLAAILSDVQS